MAENTIVAWQNSYSVGIRLIDEQHKELIRLTNKLFSNCNSIQERDRQIFLDTIHEVADYVGYHFGTEEKVMEKVKYPKYDEHKKEHTDFAREVSSKLEDFNTGKMRTSFSFVYYLRDWVLHHIAENDRQMGEHLQALHTSGELKKMTLRVKKDEATNRLEIH